MAIEIYYGYPIHFFVYRKKVSYTFLSIIQHRLFYCMNKHFLLNLQGTYKESLANTLVVLFVNNSMNPFVITLLFIVYNNIFGEF